MRRRQTTLDHDYFYPMRGDCGLMVPLESKPLDSYQGLPWDSDSGLYFLWPSGELAPPSSPHLTQSTSNASPTWTGDFPGCECPPGYWCGPSQPGGEFRHDSLDFIPVECNISLPLVPDAASTPIPPSPVHPATSPEDWYPYQPDLHSTGFHPPPSSELVYTSNAENPTSRNRLPSLIITPPSHTMPTPEPYWWQVQQEVHPYLHTSCFNPDIWTTINTLPPPPSSVSSETPSGSSEDVAAGAFQVWTRPIIPIDVTPPPRKQEARKQEARKQGRKRRCEDEAPVAGPSAAPPGKKPRRDKDTARSGLGGSARAGSGSSTSSGTVPGGRRKRKNPEEPYAHLMHTFSLNEHPC